MTGCHNRHSYLCSLVTICCCVVFVLSRYQEVLSAPAPATATTDTENERSPRQNPGEPVWSHGESYAVAYATGEGAVLETDSWTNVDNHGGLQVTTVTSDGTVIGYEVAGMTNCSQESYAYASGAWTANALAYGLCNSTVLLDQPVSNHGVGKEEVEVDGSKISN